MTPHPPYSREGTSHDAAHSMEGSAEAIRERMYWWIANSSAYGFTCDELEAWLDLRHQTASARITELANAHRIVDSGKTRPTRSGRKAIVWIVPTGQGVLI